MSPADQHPLEMLILNAAFDAGGSIEMAALRDAVPADGNAIRKAIVAQRMIGNIRQIDPADPISLTSSARAAIAAGRAHRSMIAFVPARRQGKAAAAARRAIANQAFAPLGASA